MIRAIIGAALSLLLTAPAVAADFTVSPINVHLKQGRAAETITLTNKSTETLRIQVSGFAWGQREDGQMQLDQTDDLVFFPQLLTIPPLEKRAVRVGLAKPMVAPTERTYRLMLLNLPSLDSQLQPQTASVTMQMQLSIPVFLDPLHIAPQPGVEIGAVADGKFSVRVTNHGNAHFLAKKIDMSARDGQGATMFAQSLNPWYILANGERTYDIAIDRAQCGKLHDVTVAIETDGGTIKQTLPITGASGCQLR